MATPQLSRTYLEAVNRMLPLIGENQVGTLLSPTQRVQIAMTAVEDARDEIWESAKWEWRREYYDIGLVANEMWYELPVNFDEMASRVSMNRTTTGLNQLSWKQFEDKYPDLRQYPPGSDAINLTLAGQSAAQSHNSGEPTDYVLDGKRYIGLMPIPNSTFVALENYRLVFHYFRQAPALAGDNADIGLPKDLWGTHHDIAMGIFKKAIEYKDWQADAARGEHRRKKRVADMMDGENLDVYYNPTANYNE